MKVPWMGKDVNHISVGNWKGGFDFTDPRDAWDAISDAAIDNPYLITVQGRHTYQHDIGGPAVPAWLFAGKEYISLLGLDAWLIRELGSNESGGGTVQIADDSSSTENIWFGGFTVINELTGSVTEGSPPEGALYVGAETTYPTTLRYNDIYIIRNKILGSHDAFQLFGHMCPADGGPAIPGRIVAQSNRIASNHDPYTIKGDMILESSWNQIRSNSEGVHDLIPNMNAWKTTGIHFNHAEGISAAAARGADQLCSFDHETIDVWAGANLPTMLAVTAGIYMYSNGAPYRCRFDHTKIRYRFDVDRAIPDQGAIYIKGNVDIPAELIRFSHMAIEHRQENSGASAPATIWAVNLDTSGSAAEITVANSSVLAFNAKGGTQYALGAQNAVDTIKHGGIISGQGKDTGLSGTYTAIPALT